MTALTGPVCPVSAARNVPSTCHNVIRLSFAADATRVPEGSKLTGFQGAWDRSSGADPEYYQQEWQFH